MFKELINAFKKSDALGEMIGRFGEMLDTGQWMFETACDVVEKKQPVESVRDELYRRDRTINRLEYAVRERILVHLATGDNKQDVGMCLVLMSVVKDAERIGDYCKNLFEIGKFFHSEYRLGQYSGPLEQMRRTITQLFPRIRDAFVHDETEGANAAIEECMKARLRCDLMIQQLLAPSGAGAPDEAVACVLRARFFKRVASHLANIATSVNNPVPMIDFRAGKPLDEPES